MVFFQTSLRVLLVFTWQGQVVGARPPLKPPGVELAKNLGQEAPPNHRLKAPKHTLRVRKKTRVFQLVLSHRCIFCWGVGECVVFWERERCFFMVLLLLTLSCWWNHGTSWNIICRLPCKSFGGRFGADGIPGTKKKSSRGRRNPEEATGSSGGHIQWTLFDATTCLGLLLSPEIRVLNRKRWKDIGRRKLNDGRRMGTWHMALQGLIWLLHSDRWEICSWTFSGFRRWQQQLAFARYLRRHPSRTNGCKSYVRDYKNIFQNSEGPLSIPSWDQGTWGTRTWQKETIKDYRV